MWLTPSWEWPLRLVSDVKCWWHHSRFMRVCFQQHLLAYWKGGITHYLGYLCYCACQHKVEHVVIWYTQLAYMLGCIQLRSMKKRIKDFTYSITITQLVDDLTLFVNSITPLVILFKEVKHYLLALRLDTSSSKSHTMRVGQVEYTKKTLTIAGLRVKSSIALRFLGV